MTHMIEFGFFRINFNVWHRRVAVGRERWQQKGAGGPAERV